MSDSNKTTSDNKQKKVPRPYNPDKTPFSWDKLDGLLAYKATLVVCSDILECGQTTIKEHIRKRYDMTFTEYAEKKLSRTKVKLVQKAIEQAMSGNTTMLIFCLKNICKWTDKQEDTAETIETAKKLVVNL